MLFQWKRVEPARHAELRFLQAYLYGRAMRRMVGHIIRYFGFFVFARLAHLEQVCFEFVLDSSNDRAEMLNRQTGGC